MFPILSLLVDVIFSTAHKSKGLEFDTVIVADDYTAEFEIETGGFDSDDNASVCSYNGEEHHLPTVCWMCLAVSLT